MVRLRYTVFLSLMLREQLSIQHTPWDETDGGAGATTEGLTCLDFWLRDLQVLLLLFLETLMFWVFRFDI